LYDLQCEALLIVIGI